MAVTKTWNVIAMDSAPTEGSLNDVVKTIHWTATGTETVESHTYVSSSFGAIGIGDADASDFTAFASITKDDAVAWAKAALGNDKVTSIETGLEDKITEQKTPSIETKPLPWS